MQCIDFVKLNLSCIQPGDFFYFSFLNAVDGNRKKHYCYKHEEYYNN